MKCVVKINCSLNLIFINHFKLKQLNITYECGVMFDTLRLDLIKCLFDKSLLIDQTLILTTHFLDPHFLNF